jgi:hypothetical protein
VERDDLRAVEPLGPVDAPIADEANVAIGDIPARPREHHVRDARTALETEDRLPRVVRPGPDAGDRHRDKARPRIRCVLRDDQRAAVSGNRAGLRLVGARVQGQVAGLCPRRNGDGLLAPQTQVGEAGHEHADDRQRHDPCGGEDTSFPASW